MTLNKIKSYIRLLRPEQYYKNLVIFLALYFSGNALRPELFLSSLLGFAILCLASSAGYIVNDIADRRLDRHNREKANRPLARGDVPVYFAAIMAAALIAASLTAAYALNKQFALILLAMFALTTAYSFVLKNELFADVIAISFNYVLRVVSGAAIIGVWASPWLVSGAFFLALFMATGKRKSEKAFLNRTASHHRPLLGEYSDSMLQFLLHTSATVLIISYTLYSFLGNKHQLILTLPFALYIILRYVWLIEGNAQETRVIHKIFLDKKILAAALLYMATSFPIIYLM